jgi:hypothetical protein
VATTGQGKVQGLDWIETLFGLGLGLGLRIIKEKKKGFQFHYSRLELITKAP